MKWNIFENDNIIYDMFRRPQSFTPSDLFHAVRQAQNISQASVAQLIGVSQAAVAQFEKGRHTLSSENLRKMAPLINMNPDFFVNAPVISLIREDYSPVNPFRQRKADEIIKLILPESTSHEVSYDLVQIIEKCSLRVDVRLMRAPDIACADLPKILKLQKERLSICAFAMRDVDGNLFVCRRKGRFAFFYEGEIKGILSNISMEGKRSFLVREADISEALFEQVMDWSHIDAGLIGDLFGDVEKGENLQFVCNLVSSVCKKSGRKTNEESRIINAVEKVGEEYYSKVLPDILTEIEKIIIKYSGLKLR